MNKKTFFAEQWLQSATKAEGPSVRADASADSCPIKARFPKFIHHRRSQTPPVVSDRFSPINCFTPGWKGDSLTSKTVMKFERLLSVVQHDVTQELLRTKDFPRSIKVGLYNEFLSYAESNGIIADKMDDLSSFWNALTPEGLENHPHLAQFIELYAGRVATITFLKLRFISSLVDRAQLEMTDKALLYPTAFLSQIFKKGSHLELNSRAFESNLYSWYRPLEGMKEVMRGLTKISRDLSIAEIIKNVSVRTVGRDDQQKVYSHALSHVSVGLFLNSLQINYPMWVEAIEGNIIPSGSLEQQQIISCKYFGDYLESLSLSHWLAQENNKDFRWDEMLCPDFKGLEFTSGTFAKICNELYFLTFLAHKAEHQNERPVEYICKITGGHFRNRKGNSAVRGGLPLEEDNPFFSSTYDRVVLNLFQFPKNNPQHFLMNQILDQVKYLKPNGYLFVLSSKKLFVPSLRERLEPILKELKTEAIIDLENVKGKGELGSYIYIFRKTNQTVEDRQLCSYFRISGELDSFAQFSTVSESLRSFYLSHLNEVPPMAQLEFQDSFRLEFYQEAIVGGMLIHSASEDSSRITHPAYFKSLLSNCVPLESLFDIRNLGGEEPQIDTGLNLGLRKDVSYFLVVDFRRPEVQLELHPMDTYRSILSEYGQTLCSYFQLTPKILGLNPNILRTYFNTPVGRQVTLLTFTGGPSLVKGSLKKFFVPKFLTQTEVLPDNIRNAFALLDMDGEKLLESAPATIIKSYNHIDQISRDLFPRYACEILSRLANFERILQTLIWRMDDNRYGQKLSFNNPVVQGQLVQKVTKPLYPDNDDVFLEFVTGSGPSDLHLPLTDIQMTITQEGELKLHSLELISGKKVIVRLHAEEGLILFIHYLLGHAINVPISRLLRAVHIPSLQDLKEVIESSRSFKENFEVLLTRVQKTMTEAFRLNMAAKR